MTARHLVLAGCLVAALTACGSIPDLTVPGGVVELPVEASGGEAPPYERSAFGDGWASTGGDCDVRDAILARDVENVTNSDGCGPLAGTLRDPYTGVVVVGPTRQYDVDHVLPLALSWRLGAWRWTDDQREQFANDPDNLVTTTAKVNRSKSDKGLDEWLPRVGVCDYAQRFDAVGDQYGLVAPERDEQVAEVCRTR